MGSAGGRGVSLTCRTPVLHSPSLVWKSGEGNNFFSGLCWCLCPPALMQGCVCSVWEAEQGKATGTQMLCSFSVLWPELRPVVCQTCLNLVEVRSGTGAGMYPVILWLALHRETQELMLLVGDTPYPSLEWLSLSTLKMLCLRKRKCGLCFSEMLQGGQTSSADRDHVIQVDH